jgi:hypothetical protein
MSHLDLMKVWNSNNLQDKLKFLKSSHWMNNFIVQGQSYSNWTMVEVALDLS